MAWEELLRKRDDRPEGQETAQGTPQGGEKRSAVSLIQQVGDSVGQPVNNNADAADEGLPEPVRCRDGYVRRSPVQAYQTAPDYRARMIRRIVLLAVVLCLGALLVVALMRSGLFRLR